MHPHTVNHHRKYIKRILQMLKRLHGNMLIMLPNLQEYMVKHTSFLHSKKKAGQKL